MQKFTVYFFVILLSSCQASNNATYLSNSKIIAFLEQANEANKRYNDSVGKTGIITTHKGYNPTKAIFAKLKEQLATSQELVYLLVWQNDMPAITGNFRSIIYNPETNTRYYSIGSANSKVLHVDTIYTEIFVSDTKLLNAFLLNDMQQIKRNQGKFLSSHAGDYYIIYRFNLNRSTGQVFKFEDVVWGSEHL